MQDMVLVFVVEGGRIGLSHFVGKDVETAAAVVRTG